MDPTMEQHQILCKSQKKSDRDPGNVETSVQGRKHEPYTRLNRMLSSGLTEKDKDR
jgi:hypothetical protein